MARKEITIVIDTEGRDKDKVFVIREMPAMQAERWATRVFMGAIKSGLDIPDNIRDMGIMGVAMLGAKAIGGMDYNYAAPLLEEMMTCVKVIPEPTKPSVTRPPIEEDFEEISTILRLRKEVMKLHVNFSELAGQLNSDAATA